MTFNSKIFRTSTFRLAAIYLIFFAFSVCAVLAYVYWNTVGILERQTDETIRAEVQVAEFVRDLDPYGRALFSVSWAGEDVSENWFDPAREYTERWHHQQQVRDAVSKPGILTNEFYYPVLDTFMRALPFNYRNTHAEAGTVLQVSITGDGGGEWFLEKGVQWVLDKKNSSPVNTKISIDGNIAWKLFTKSWRKESITNNISIEGDATLAEPVLDMVTVVA